MKSRESRKLDHIRYALHLDDGPCLSGFSDVHLLHNCLPEIKRSDVSLAVTLPGIGSLPNPLLINAMTGGADEVTEINRQLARTARDTGCAMAVGSEYGCIRSGLHQESFRVIRKENPDGVVFANLSAFADVESGKKAVELIGANALQIHLNAAQELSMEEGDRDFSHCLFRIEALCHALEVPVIVKETGCGMAREQAKALLDCGVSVLDIGGAGGTNFPAIEHCRYNDGNDELMGWGIPTVLSLMEVVEAAGWQQGIIASGGIRTALEVVKAQVLGANAVGMAGNILRFVHEGGAALAVSRIMTLLEQMKDFYVLLGCVNSTQLRRARYYLTGETADAVRSLGIGGCHQ